MQDDNMPTIVLPLPNEYKDTSDVLKTLGSLKANWEKWVRDDSVPADQKPVPYKPSKKSENSNEKLAECAHQHPLFRDIMSLLMPKPQNPKQSEKRKYKYN